MKYFALLVLSVFVTQVSFGQYKFQEKYDFAPPLDIPLVLAANFGELRSNHFHTGLDFKTQHREGLNLHSIDDGYVYRVKVSPYGYGSVVYINHPNGLTSVYAHCSEFKGQLDSLVKATQRKEENFEIEIFPGKDGVKVKKNEIFALSGNSGSSTAPHLHFEIRETVTEHPLNPLLFGFDVADNRKPEIRRMKVYSLTQEGYRVPNKAKTYSVNGSDGNYTINYPIELPADYCSNTGGIGFAFDAIDRLDGANNVCGIFKTTFIVDGDTVFGQDISELSFETSRHINTHKDYEDYHNSPRKQYQKSFKTKVNPLEIYLNGKTGILKWKPGSKHQLKYVVTDTKGNTSVLNFSVSVAPGQIANLDKLYSSTNEYLFPDSAYMDIDDEHWLLFPPKLVYEPTKIIQSKGNPFQFGDSDVPVQNYYKIMFKLDNPKLETEKYVITVKNKSGRTKSVGGTYKDGWITTRVREFGEFGIDSDTTAPSVSKSNFSANQNVKGKTLYWRIGDNLSGLADYDVYIDEKWHLLEFEPKKRSVYSTMPSNLSGEHTLKIVAKDKCGNVFSEEWKLVF